MLFTVAGAAGSGGRTIRDQGCNFSRWTCSKASRTRCSCSPGSKIVSRRLSPFCPSPPSGCSSRSPWWRSGPGPGHGPGFLGWQDAAAASASVRRPRWRWSSTTGSSTKHSGRRRLIQERDFGSPIGVVALSHYATWSHCIDLVLLLGGQAEPDHRATGRAGSKPSQVRRGGRPGSVFPPRLGCRRDHPRDQRRRLGVSPVRADRRVRAWPHPPPRPRPGHGGLGPCRSGVHEVFRPSRETSRWDKYDASFDKSVAAYLDSIRMGEPPPVAGSGRPPRAPIRSEPAPIDSERRPGGCRRDVPHRPGHLGELDAPHRCLWSRPVDVGDRTRGGHRCLHAGAIRGRRRAARRFSRSWRQLVDTAHIYGFGKSEMTLGRWFEETGRRDEVFLVTKGCHPVVDPDDMFARPWLPRVTPQAIRADLDESLRRLRTDRVDLYLLHRGRGIGRVRAAPRGPQPRTGAGSDPRVRRIELDACDESTRPTVRQRPWPRRFRRLVPESEPGPTDPDVLPGHPVRRRLDPGVASGPAISLCSPGPHSQSVSPAAGSVRRTGPSMMSPGSTSPTTTWIDFVGRRSLPPPRRDSSARDRPCLCPRSAVPVTALVGPSTVPHLEDSLHALDVRLTPEELRHLDLKSS